MAESKTAGTANMKDGKRLLWIARACMIIILVGVSITSYYFYAPYVYPSLWRQIGQPMAHVVEYGAPLLFITVFAWIWPTAGGIVAILYGAYRIFLDYPGTLIPAPAFYILYGIFTIGGIISLLVGLRLKVTPHPESTIVKRLQWAARIAAVLPIVLTVFVYWLINPSPFLLGAVPGLITAGIAWFWPAPGGFLMLLLAIPGFYALFESNWDFQQKLPAYIFCIIFIASGLLHLIIAWRGRKLH